MPLTFLEKWKKTVILIDHEGKNKADSFGSMGKEVQLDTIIKIVADGKSKRIEITKNRNFELDKFWLSYHLECDEEGGGIRFMLDDRAKNKTGSKNVHDETCEAEVKEDIRKQRAEVVRDYVNKYPTETNKNIIKMITEQHPGLGGKSTLNSAISDAKKALVSASHIANS